MHVLKIASARVKGCLFRSMMQMDAQGEGDRGKIWNAAQVAMGSQDPCWDYFLPPRWLFLHSFVFRFHACVAIFLFLNLSAPSCHLKHQTWTALISDVQVKASFTTWFPLTILSLGANIYKLLKWANMLHLLSLGRMLSVAECWGRCKSLNLQQLFASFVWLW